MTRLLKYILFFIDDDDEKEKPTTRTEEANTQDQSTGQEEN